MVTSFQGMSCLLARVHSCPQSVTYVRVLLLPMCPVCTPASAKCRLSPTLGRFADWSATTGCDREHPLNQCANGCNLQMYALHFATFHHCYSLGNFSERCKIGIIGEDWGFLYRDASFNHLSSNCAVRK